MECEYIELIGLETNRQITILEMVALTIWRQQILDTEFVFHMKWPAKQQADET